MSKEAAFCSWCFTRSAHILTEQNFARRNVYKCGSCEKRTVECRYCTHMARGDENGWDSELCAEHNGEIASFERNGADLQCLSDFETIFKRDTINLKGTGVKVACSVVGAAVLTPIAVAAAPAVAASLGAAGLLGAAGSGTAISTLSGAALTSASMAAIGGGTVAGGAAVAAVAGTALGAHCGGKISNSYFGQVEGFGIRKVQGGNKHAIIFVNGFLSQGSDDIDDWKRGLKAAYRRNHWYHLSWEAKRLRDLGAMLGGAPNILASGAVAKLASTAGKNLAARASPLSGALIASDVLSNPWHSAMKKAEMTGVLLADAISRTPKWRFTLAGHSLGARVIYFALEELARRNHTKRIRDVFLLGGAVSNEPEGWERAASAVSGFINNCYSKNDSVLAYAYRIANAGQSTPIGYEPINTRHDRIRNLDRTPTVAGHMDWKCDLPSILESLRSRSSAAQ